MRAGAPIGSTRIDLASQRRVLERLQIADSLQPLNIDIEMAAEGLTRSAEFQNAKCQYGQSYETEYFSIAVPTLSKNYTNENCNIHRGEMKFARYVCFCVCRESHSICTED